MVAVARRAGVATGSVYRHFPSKGDLFAEVVPARRRSARSTSLVELDRRRAGDASGSPAWVEAFVRRALAEPVRAYALIAEPVDPAVEAERLTFRRAYADLFARALRDGIACRRAPARTPTSPPPAIVGALAEALLGPLAAPRRRTPTRSSPACSPSSCPIRRALMSTLHVMRSSTSPSRSRTSTCSTADLALREALEREGARLGGRPRARLPAPSPARPRRRSTAAAPSATSRGC